MNSKDNYFQLVCSNTNDRMTSFNCTYTELHTVWALKGARNGEDPGTRSL